MSLINELAILFVVAATFSIIARLLKQPLIVAHIFTGLVVGPLFFNLIQSRDTLEFLGEIGISFLLFIVGLSLTPQAVREIGRVAIIAGVVQVIITSFIGYFIAVALGFSTITSIYLGIALAFSSTIIVIKLLSDKKDTEKLYGKISIGFLLVQDVIAILVLILIPFASTGDASLRLIAATLAKGLGFAVIVPAVAWFVIKRFHIFFSRSQELLFLFANAWGLGIAVIARALGFSLESGALLAGVALSVIPSRFEISARLKPLRDFFIVIFFILLGAQATAHDVRIILSPAAVFSVFVLVGNPLILMAIMGLLGYKKKTSFLTALTVGQVSEFSLILILLGVKLGALPVEIVTLLTLVALLTILGSAYFILHSEVLYALCAPFLGIFERKNTKENERLQETYDMILFGYNRIGFDFLNVFEKIGKKFMVVDYNPDTVRELEKNGYVSEFGDAGDIEFVRALPLKDIRLAVSTIPDIQTNVALLKEIKRESPEAVFISVAHTIQEAMDLYRHGAQYVIMPHFLGGTYASLIVEKNRFNLARYTETKAEHLKYLKERQAVGHEHPVAEKNIYG